MTKWILKRCRADVKKMSLDLNISKVMATVLANRGIYDRESALTYMQPNKKNLKNTMELKDVKNAFDLLVSAKKHNKKVVVYGDYDVDGVTSTVILYKMLKEYGVNVEYRIPNRVENGYGLSIDMVKDIYNDGCELLFTCDNGIAALEEIALAKELGMDVIVLDHHEPLFDIVKGKKVEKLPVADAVIDAKQESCNYPFKMLCAGGMSYKFAVAFFEYVGINSKLDEELLVLGGIATVCDIVDLVDENRIIAKNSLNLLNEDKNVNLGLSELINVCGLEDRVISEYSYGFIIGPSINASGRLDDAKLAVELLLTEDIEKAKELANILHTLNSERKDMTNRYIDEIIEQIENSELKNDKVLVIYNNQVHESIVGIIAGKIKESYNKPTIVITDGDGCAKGSARSIDKYNIFEELNCNRDILIKAGGHAMAAGLSLEKENINILRERLNNSCELSEEDMEPVIKIDMQLRFSDIYLGMVEELRGMMPYGKANEEPVFGTKGVYVKRANFVGANKNIIQLVMEDRDKVEVRGIIFDKYEQFIDILKINYNDEDVLNICQGSVRNLNICMDILYKLDLNEYNGQKNVQLVIKDIR